MIGDETPGRGDRRGHGGDARPPRRLVPVYAVTGGRTRPEGRELPMESLVTVTERVRWARGLEAESRAIVEMARRPVSIVEICAALAVPVPVGGVLVGDLVDQGFLTVHAPPPAFGGRPGPAVLTRLLDGLRAR